MAHARVTTQGTKRVAHPPSSHLEPANSGIKWTDNRGIGRQWMLDMGGADSWFRATNFGSGHYSTPDVLSAVTRGSVLSAVPTANSQFERVARAG